MTQAVGYGFPPSSDNRTETSQSYGLEPSFNVSQDSRPPGTLSVNMLNSADRQAPAAEPNGETGMGQNGGLHGQHMYHQDTSAVSRPGNTEYDNFLAIAGLGVKMPSQGSEAASRPGLGSELDRLKGQPQQGIPGASLQEYLNGMTRPPSSGQILNLHSRLPPSASINMLHPDVASPPGIGQEHQQSPVSALSNHMLANGTQHTPPEFTAAPPASEAKPMEEKREQAQPAPASDIQQLLLNISMPQMNGVSRSSSRNSILNLNGMPPTPTGGGSLADVLAAVQPQPSAAPKPDAKDGETSDAPAAQPAGASEAPAPTQDKAPQPAVRPGISAFAAVADSPLDEDASKAAASPASKAPAQQDAPPALPALPPPQAKPGALAGPQLAQNLFDPPFPTVASSSSFTAEGPAVRPVSAQEGLLSRIPNPEHAALLQHLQQYAPEASNEDLLRALHTHILQQQAQLQQRNSAPVAQNGPLAASGGMNPNAGLGAALGNHASYPGAGNNDMLRQGMLTRGGLPQQMNRQVYPGQVPGQVSGQMGGRVTPPAGLQPPFQGLAERALAGMEPYNNAQPKPQATTQQMRFGGNIGVHAINRTSAAPLNNPTQQQMPQQQQQLLQQPGGLLGGQGMGPMGNMGGLNSMSAMNNPLGGLPGAPRPAIRPPNWQRAQAMAQQAAQAQAQQQAAIKMAAARAEAQRQAQLQAAQQQNRQNFLAGLTPAQVQLLMNAPAHQVNALAAQLGMLDTGARPGNVPGNLPGSLPSNLGAPAPNLAANQAMLQQQKLAAARANFASQQAQAQRTPANPMLGLQQPPQQPLMGLQQARPGVRNMPGPVNKFGAPGVGNPSLNVPAQPAQVGPQGAALPPRTNVVEMGRYLAQNGISVEQAVNSGILGGFSAFDVRALSEGHHQELQRLRNAHAQQAAQAAAVSQQQVQQQQQQQQLLQQQLLRQNQLQQLQQAQAAQQQAQAAQGAAQNSGDPSSQGATPSATSVMNVGQGALGQLFDWGAGPAQQQALPGPGTPAQGGNWDPNSIRSLMGGPMGSALHPQLGGSAGALSGLVGGLPGAPLARNPSDAGSEHNLSLHNLRSKSPWEGGAMAMTQPQSAHSSHATTPRSARPGTMGSLLEVPATGFGAIGQPAAPRYPSQGSLDGEFTGYVKPNPGAQAPIGRGSKTSQAEVPSSVRAFWETGASHPGNLSTSVSLDSNRAPGYSYNPPSNTMEPALDLEALDAALEAQSNNLAGGQASQRIAPEMVRIPGSAGQQGITAPGDLNSFDSGNYSFFNQAALAEAAPDLRGLSLESEIEDRAGIGNLLDDIGLNDAPKQAPKN